MRLAATETVRPGVYLAKTIYDASGRVLLAKGTYLTPEYIKRLMELEYRSIYIEDEISESIEIEDIIPEETRTRMSQMTKKILFDTKSDKKLQERIIKQAVNDVIDEIIQNRDALIHLTEIRSLEDNTFGHSVNVCVLSVLTGVSIGYDQLKLKELGMGALLHDVGKAKLPDEINNAKELSEQDYQLYQKHCEYGREILKNTENISIRASQVAFQHHERYDGSGYPRGISGKEIFEFARIVAIADVYDTLAGYYPHRKRMFPHEVLELIKSKQGSDFDPEIVASFIPNIAPFPSGSIVLLSNGYKAIVVSAQKANPTRPQIRLLYDGNGQKFEGIKYIDLMLHPSLFITEATEDASGDLKS